MDKKSIIYILMNMWALILSNIYIIFFSMLIIEFCVIVMR